MRKGKFIRKTGKKTASKTNVGRPPTRALAAPKPYLFKRTISQVVTLSASDDFWVTQAANLGKAWAFSLSELQGDTDFTSLFKYYRLKGARVQMYFSNTGSVTSSNTNSAISPDAPNSQIMVTVDRNVNGETADVANESHYLQSQTAKRYIAIGGDRKPIDFYMPLKQGNLIYQNSSTSNNTLMTPKFISTDNPDTPHWGFNTLFQRVDGEAFSIGMGNRQSVRIMTTIYFECKKVE